MKVIAINGSPNINGNTNAAINIVKGKLQENKIEVEVVQLGTQTIPGCIGCYACASAKNKTCVVYNDIVNEVVKKIEDADGILLASPVHMAGPSATMKAFLDRLFIVCNVNDMMLRHKVGAGLVVLRRSGGMPALDQLYYRMMHTEMIIPTSNYWNIIHGGTSGVSGAAASEPNVHMDLEGVQIMERLGNNMAWLINTLEKGKNDKPQKNAKVFTNFVR